MTQENEVKDSTTNTAARELPSNDHLRLHLGEMTAQEMRTAKAAYRLALTETLTQQQGGEQEATCAGCNGRGEVGGWAGDGYQTDPCPFCTPSGLPDALTGDFDCPKAAECRACPCGFCTALRSKQPAASEGDGRKVIEQCRAALSEELAAYDIEPPIAHVKDAHDACVTWLAEHSIRALYTTPPTQQEARAVCAEDLRWLDDIAGDLKQAGGPTNNMRLIALNRAIAALQAGAP